MSQPPFAFIEVCAGAGGLSKGFIDEGFTPILLNDNDKHCCATLQKNHPGITIHHGSMVDLDLSQHGKMEVDVLMGGVPCQSFSQAGKRAGIQDPRGQLMLRFIEMVRDLEPKVFLIENVKGLKTHQGGKTLESIIAEFAKIGKYNIHVSVLNANDYNVPQNRERIIIVGTHITIPNTFSFPEKDTTKPVLRDALADCPESDGAQYNELKCSLFNKIPQGGCWVNLPEDLQRSYLGNSYHSGGGKRGILKRLDMDKPSLTLMTTPSQKQTERCHPIETRPLQIREYARIQTFPDDYIFTGSTNQIYKQIGNAVPVNLASALARQVRSMLTPLD